MLRRRSLLVGFALAALQATAAIAQQVQPWTGIAANEARPATPQQYGNGGNEMMPRTMSADGRFVIFDSNLSHLVAGDTNNWNDVFLRDRQTGELRIVSVASDGSQGNHLSGWSTISSNGRHIAFNSCATNFDPADTNGSCDLFVHDRVLGTTVRANLGPSGEQATSTTQYQFNLSADGRYFVFLARFAASGEREVWLRDRDTDENGVFDEAGTAITTLISQASVGAASLSGFEDVAISPDGRWIAYNALTFDPTYGPAGTRLYLHDRSANTTVRVDLAMAGGVDIPAYSAGADFSESGHLVYSSNADNLAEGDTDGNDDVYVYDIATGVNTPIELSYPGAPFLDAEWSPAISADGRYVSFTGAEWGSWNTLYNVYAVDRQTGLSYEISVRPDGSRDNNAYASSISADGSAIAFAASAEMLLYGWGNQGVFVATGVALSPSEIAVPAEGGTFTIDVTMPAGIAWTLNTAGASGAEFSQTSGVGPATIDVTLWDNNSGEEQDFYVQLGTEQVILHQTVQPIIWWINPWEGGPEGGTAIEVYGDAFAPGATVTIDGIPATNVVVVDSETITATTPAHQGLGWVNVTVTNPSGASGSLDQAFRYMDATPPVVTYEIAGTPGQNGWYTGDVQVTWNYEDPESTVFIIWCENPYTQTTDASQIAICNVTSDGGQTIGEVEVKRDTMPPVIAISPSVPETYVQGEVVPIAHYCSDFTSGIATCTPNQTGPSLDTSAVGTFEFSVTAVDMAGHTTTNATSYTVKMATAIDLPSVTTVYGGGATLRATLLGSGTPLAGRTIALFVDNVAAGSAITSAAGEAVLNLAPGAYNAGTYQVRAEFAGDEDAFASTSFSELIVEKVTPILTWSNPAPIVHGTALGGTQLNATSPVPGAFGYNPDAGAVLPPGSHTLTANFAPQDSTNYNTASKTVTLKVKAVPEIAWATPPPLEYPYSLSGTHLNATASVPGTFLYSPASGWQLLPGTHTLSVTFTPTNQVDYATATASVTIEVLKGTSTITWVVDTGIYYGTPLGANQLNATASTAGTFVYDPPAGTVLPAGTHTLTVVFTPNSANYNPATKSISLLVGKYPSAVLWDFPAPITYGTPLGPVQQNATSNVPGTFTYSPPPGTILEIGQHWITVLLTPDDPANYDTGSSYASITVLMGVSTVSWSNPAPIVYPQPLHLDQLNATASVPGSFSYTPGYGAVLPAGTHTLHVAFTPTDSSHYWGASKDVSIVVAKRTPTITWNNPSGIGYGTALSAAQLNATANIPGTFAYSPAAGTILGAGTHALSVTFTPTDTANNLPATANASITIAAAAPVVSWANPSDIAYGTALSSTQLNATANVPGTFAYAPADGTVLNAGTHALSVTFTPADSINYTAASAAVSIEVGKVTPMISWANPAAVTYGTALSATQLNATASVPGTFAYAPGDGTVLNAGTHALSVTFTPADAINYTAASAAVSIEVGKVTPVISWANPAGVTYGTALSATQLNATANVAGTFAYAPADGTVLNAGTHALSVTFTPADGANYTSATAAVSIVIAPAALTVQTNNAGKVYGQALPAFTATGTGFVNGDSLGSLAGALSFGTSATDTSAPGTYPVTPSGVSSANYTITFAAGTLTVTQAATAVVMTTTPNPSHNNQVVQLLAVVSAVAPGAGTPTGTVEFRENATLLGTATLVNGVATMNKNFKKGAHPLTATYTGSANFTNAAGGVTHQVP